MARLFTNVSGETRTLQDSHGRWHVVEPGEIYTADARDERDYDQPGVWEQMPDRPVKTRTKKDEEAV